MFSKLAVGSWRRLVALRSTRIACTAIALAIALFACNLTCRNYGPDMSTVEFNRVGSELWRGLTSYHPPPTRHY
ncbi:uncharacterized protein BDV14DRAFT_164608 [Aspergillus stella-maris]|uniref:uncharacterized protein n=1 Tax=Aspergillus stella-maris TaxID=1810926 RepID=UPI003CCD6340